MKTLAVQQWPGPAPAPQDGLFAILIRIGAPAHAAISAASAAGAQRDAARRQIRSAAREALAAVLGIPADDIDIDSTRGTAPQVLLSGMPCPIGCSFAYEDGHALAAVNLRGAIGADLMRVQDIPDWQAVARDYLGPAVSATLLATAADDRPRAFAQAWTRREAAFKCAGQALAEWRADLDGQATTPVLLAMPLPDLVGHIHVGAPTRA
jgi:4'-phosphopantetheinyl transferase